MSPCMCHPQGVAITKQYKPNRWHNDEQARVLIQYTFILFYGVLTSVGKRVLNLHAMFFFFFRRYNFIL